MDSVTTANKRAALTQAVVKVGTGGRGFVVETAQGERIIITAAHCVAADDRRLPPPHPFSYTHERVYERLLGPLGKAKPTIWATCLFADPVADIAVLGGPDDQVLPDQAEAYQQQLMNVTPFAAADAPKQGTERVKGYSGRGLKYASFKVPTPGQGTALVLSLDGKWIECAVERRGPWLWIAHDKMMKGGMSGSPIVSAAGEAIGVISTGSLNPVLVDALPPRIGLGKARSKRTL